jgi:hypothetical protein
MGVLLHKLQGVRPLKRRQLIAHSLVCHSCAAVATVRNAFSFETVVDFEISAAIFSISQIKEAWLAC